MKTINRFTLCAQTDKRANKQTTRDDMAGDIIDVNTLNTGKCLRASFPSVCMYLSEQLKNNNKITSNLCIEKKYFFFGGGVRMMHAIHITQNICVCT